MRSPTGSRHWQKPSARTPTASRRRWTLWRIKQLLRITYLKTESPHLVGRATPDAAGKARPTGNHLTVMNYVKLNSYTMPERRVAGLTDGCATSLWHYTPHG